MVTVTFTTSFLLSSLKWAVPTTYTRLPSSATSSVTVRGSRGRSRRRFSFISSSRLKASASAARTQAAGVRRAQALSAVGRQETCGRRGGRGMSAGAVARCWLSSEGCPHPP